MPKLKRPSKRAEQYAHYIAQGHSKYDAAVLAGYSLSAARNPGRTIQSQPGVDHLIFKALGPRAKFWDLAVGVNATKLELVPIFQRTDAGWKKLRGIYSVERVPDYKMRLAYLELAFKSFGWIN
jgi:hypothetical protein